MMSDSTNVLAPGRTTSEASVRERLIARVLGHAGKGRVVVTQFASNLHRLASVKAAADASGRRVAFVGMSLNTYLEAAARDGRWVCFFSFFAAARRARARTRSRGRGGGGGGALLFCSPRSLGRPPRAPEPRANQLLDPLPPPPHKKTPRPTSHKPNPPHKQHQHQQNDTNTNNDTTHNDNNPQTTTNSAPFSPDQLVPPEQLPHLDPSKVLVVTTGSQAEPKAQLSLASQSLSHNLKVAPSDLVLYSAKVIPGNEGRVTRMINSLAGLGAEVAAGRAEGLHTSGHAYQDELTEVLRFVKPQHFLPVHGEYSFLCEHAKLARERAGVQHVDVIRNGQLLGVGERRSRSAVAALGSVAAAEAAAARAGGGNALNAVMTTSAGARPGSGQMAVLGEATLYNFFNDGGRGTGTAEEMALGERTALAVEGVVVAAVDVLARAPAGGGAGGGGGGDGAYYGEGGGAGGGGYGGYGGGGGGSIAVRTRITTRGMWLDRGALMPRLHGAAKAACAQLPGAAPLGQVERAVGEALQRACKAFNNRRPEVIVVAYEGGGGGAGYGGPQQQQQQQQQRRQGGGGDGAYAFSSSSSKAGASSSSSSSGRAPRPWEEGGAAAQASGAADDGEQRAPPAAEEEEDEDEEAPAPAAEAPPAPAKRRATAARRGATASKASSSAAAAAAAASAPTAGTLPPLSAVPEGMLERRRASNPREAPLPGADVDYG
jgi:hypothetical protein